MQKILRIILLFICLMVVLKTNHAQTSTKDSSLTIHKNVISTYPLFDAFGAFNFGYERTISSQVSIYCWTAFYPFGEEPSWVIKSNSLICLFEGRFYPHGKAPQGFFAGPFILYNYTWFQYGYSDEMEAEIPSGYLPGNSNQLAIGVLVGYKFLTMKRIAAEFCFGAGRSFLLNQDYYAVGYDEKFMVLPMINIGYAFK